MTIPATGQIEETNTGHQLVIERTFKAPIGDVWRTIVEPERLNRWVGTWSGDPTTGKVIFIMTAEGSDTPEDVTIHACEAPRFLDVETAMGDDSWRMSVTLTEAAGITSLRFTQNIKPDEDFGSFGIGWEYYLDRMVAVMNGSEFANWDDYYPAQKPYWDDLAREAFPV